MPNCMPPTEPPTDTGAGGKPAPTGASGPPKGAYTVWVAGGDGQPLDVPSLTNPDRQPDPGRPDALDIYFGLNDSATPPARELIDLQLSVDKVLRACQRLYLQSNPAQEQKFRIYYTRLFRIAQLGLEGTTPVPDVANIVVAAIAADLVSDEAGNIKNAHLLKLGNYALMYSVPALLLYFVLRMLPHGFLAASLMALAVSPQFLSCFLILWVGCFTGVWLSYGIRKTTFTLADLTTADGDHLAPQIRLVFAGLLTMLIGMLFGLGLVEMKVGSVSLTSITSSPMLAFLVGAFCGISELTLPASLGNRATTFVQSIK